MEQSSPGYEGKKISKIICSAWYSIVQFPPILSKVKSINFLAVATKHAGQKGKGKTQRMCYDENFESSFFFFIIISFNLHWKEKWSESFHFIYDSNYPNEETSIKTRSPFLILMETKQRQRERTHTRKT